MPQEIIELGGQQIAQINALLNWFKHDFFSWCNAPKCQKCGDNSKMVRQEAGTPTEEDTKHGALRVEQYKCKDCDIVTRYPRYNDPVKLFQTRTGRCGEYANAFTCICTALGHEARLCHDWTDHVWTEVFIYEYNRWVHMDSCEPLFDVPHTYEQGWGKQLTYVIAISN